MAVGREGKRRGGESRTGFGFGSLIRRCPTGIVPPLRTRVQYELMSRPAERVDVEGERPDDEGCQPKRRLTTGRGGSARPIAGTSTLRAISGYSLPYLGYPAGCSGSEKGNWTCKVDISSTRRRCRLAPFTGHARLSHSE